MHLPRVLLPAMMTLGMLSAASGARALTEQELEAGGFERVVWPYYVNGRTLGTFTGEAGKRLGYVTFERDDEEGALVILHGRGGSHVYLAEMFHDLRDSGWSIYSMDHRGQGFSERLLDNPRKGHVEDWDHYSRDVKTFMDKVVNRRPHKRVVVLGISMGGAIATTFAQQYPRDVDGLILFVPMHKPNYRPFNELTAGMLGTLGTVTFQLDEYGPTQGDPKPEDEETFEDNRGTHSRIRFENGRSVAAMFPELQLGGVTYGWANEVVKANRLMRLRAVEMQMPILLLQAGQDTVVQNDGQDAFCQRAPRCRKVVFPEARHGLHNERDDMRGAAMAEVRAFLQDPDANGCSNARTGALAPAILVALGLAARRRRVRQPG